MNTIENILKALHSGQLKGALEMLVRHTSEEFASDPGLKNAAINMLARFNQLQRRRIAGLIAESEMRITENQIRYSALELLDILKEEGAAQADAVPARHGEHAPKTKILFLGAEPANQVHLSLEEEVRRIEDALYGESMGDRFELIRSVAARPDDILKLILKHKPQIVHFAGHGNKEGIYMLDDKGDSIQIPNEQLSDVFRLFREVVGCVILNSCYSKPQAMRIHDYIPFVIGTSFKVQDKASKKFASLFYTALAGGMEIPLAYEFARIGTNLNAMDGDLFTLL